MKKTILSLLIALTATIGANAQTQTYDFIMPAYDVELTTALWYKLSETATDNQVNYGTKTDVYLERTLLAGGWNTFCAPISISKQKMKTVLTSPTMIIFAVLMTILSIVELVGGIG